MKKIVVDLTKDREIIVSEDALILGLLISDSEHNSSKLRIVHDKPCLTSRIDLRTVLRNTARLDMDVEVVINKCAYNTDTHLTTKALLLSDEAKATIVPSMEIMEDKVKAGHSAVIGRPREEEVYYLSSRGLTTGEIEELLTEAFIKEIKDKIAINN